MRKLLAALALAPVLAVSAPALASNAIAPSTIDDNTGGNEFGFLTDVGPNLQMQTRAMNGDDEWFQRNCDSHGYCEDVNFIHQTHCWNADPSSDKVYTSGCNGDSNERFKAVIVQGAVVFSNLATGLNLTAASLQNDALVSVAGGPPSGENLWSTVQV